MSPTIHTINWLEVTAWTGLTLLLLASIAAAIRHIWTTLVRRVQALEAWREHHQEAHQSSDLEIKLQLRDLQNETRNHTTILEKMGQQFEAMNTRLGELAGLVGNRRRDTRPKANL